MPPLAWSWAKQVAFGSPNRCAPPDWGVELWKWEIDRYESADAIAAARARTGQNPDNDEILHEATSSLLRDVIDAAGGVERAFLRLTESIGLTQAAYEAWRVPATSDPSQPPEGRVFWSDPALEDAWYSVEELIVWARVLDDRLKRQAADRKRYPCQGLLPALADGPRRDAVVRARSALLTAGVAEARYLAGLNLHMQPMQSGSKMGRVRDGVVVLRFPDRVTEPLSHRWQLRYEQGRDAASFADQLFAGVKKFMNDLLDAFENFTPERFKQRNVSD